MTRRLRAAFLRNHQPDLPRRAELSLSGRRESKALAVLVGVALCVGLGTSFEAEDATWKRLAAMPRERREALLARLDQFDALPAAEQAAVRALDARIQAEPEVNRAELYATLRRYHSWVRSLDEAQQKTLLTAPADTRLALTTKVFAEQVGSRTPETPFYIIADFGSASPFELARQIKIWFNLADRQREVVLKTAEIGRVKQLENLGKLAGVPAIATPTKEKMDATYKTAPRSKLGPFLKKFDDVKSIEKKARLVDHYYFFQHPPDKVKAAKLLEFDNALPPWIFPAPEEMPQPKPKAAANPPASAPNAAAKPAVKPAPNPSTKAPTGPKNPF
jgi:hypothetical protein